MANIKSLRWPGVVLPSGLRVPALETIETTNDALRQIDTARALPALIAAGDIAVTYDPDPEPEGVQAAVSIEAPAEPVAEPLPPTVETPAEPVADATARKK